VHQKGGKKVGLKYAAANMGKIRMSLAHAQFNLGSADQTRVDNLEVFPHIFK
jgi:hypothetical protein